MKVLIVSAHDLHGGAGRAAFRLHQALTGIGVDSSMLVQQRLSEDPKVSGHSGLSGRVVSGVRSRVDRLPLLRYPERSQLWFSPSWLPGSGILDKINNSDADIVHLHWITGGMIRIEDVRRIEKPVVWTLHDMWPMTGGCHYDNGCGRFQESCGACPQLGSESHRDLSSWIFDRKTRSFRGRQVHLVALSRWMADQLASSPILADRPVSVLPNPLNCDVFTERDRLESRMGFGLSPEEKVILFGAVHPHNPIKGFDLFRTALDRLRSLEDVSVVVFGSVDEVDTTELPLPARFVGAIEDDRQLSALYSAADVSVVPSIQDNLPLVATESLACGTPVVAFDATGLTDIVDHMESGYLARPLDATDLAAGIGWVLKEAHTNPFRDIARRRAVEKYEASAVARSYKSLYIQVLAESDSSAHDPRNP